MTKEEKYSLAKWAIKQALENGAQDAKVSIYDSQSSSVEVREEKIDKLEQSTESGLTISLYVDKKYSSHSTNRLNNKEELSRFIKEGIAGTKFLAEDEFRTLPNPKLYYKGKNEDLGTFDADFLSLDPQKKINAAFEIEKEVLGKDERIISVTTSYYDGMSGSVMVTSNGFEGDTANTYYGLNASVSVKGGDARPESYWGESAIFHNDLKTNGIGEIALQRALNKIGQTKIESARMPMILENRLASQSLRPLISALNGSAIQQKNSFLVDKLNEKIGSDLLTITDDPFIISGRGSRLFDGEGLALKKRTIFEKGVLKSYFIDTYYGKKLEMTPNSGSTTNLLITPGKRSMEEMVATLDRGILIAGFNGGNTNGSTGDFSYGIDGFLVENGKIVKPVSEMNITGNMVELWAKLAEVGSDVYENSSWRMPSLMFKDVDFSGI
ncbi:MAG: TldD/PmbA family protein [Bacteroidales bacterium]|nr:TldD/PmbA family protein [Bacteroidales bacterium]